MLRNRLRALNPVLRLARTLVFGYRQSPWFRALRWAQVLYLATTVLLWATVVEVSQAGLFNRVAWTGWLAAASLLPSLSLGASPQLLLHRGIAPRVALLGQVAARMLIALQFLWLPLGVLALGAWATGLHASGSAQAALGLAGAGVVCAGTALLLASLASLASWASSQHAKLLFATLTVAPPLLHQALPHLPSVLDLHPWLLARVLS